MDYLKKDSNGCPYLFLAPMEGIGDSAFRQAMASVGGFDEAVTEFLRVPSNAHVKSLASRYHAEELLPYPLACQLMGSDPELMALMALEIQRKGAPRIDLNCGCPSNTVTGRGAGSSLLKDPDFLHTVAKSIVQAVSIPVTLKMRSGYDDISLFKENLKAAEESGVKFITLHPRTKRDGYGPPAKWELIQEAKSYLKIPLVGNGDIVTVDDALNMLKMTNCDALMIGRGAVINPFIFHEIRAHFSKKPYVPKWEELLSFFNVFISKMPSDMRERTKVNKLKQILNFQFQKNPKLLLQKQKVLASLSQTVEDFMKIFLPCLEECYFTSQNGQES